MQRAHSGHTWDTHTYSVAATQETAKELILSAQGEETKQKHRSICIGTGKQLSATRKKREQNIGRRRQIEEAAHTAVETRYYEGVEKESFLFRLFGFGDVIVERHQIGCQSAVADRSG
jgi:hypothetical protein